MGLGSSVARLTAARRLATAGFSGENPLASSILKGSVLSNASAAGGGAISRGSQRVLANGASADPMREIPHRSLVSFARMALVGRMQDQGFVRNTAHLKPPVRSYSVMTDNQQEKGLDRSDAMQAIEANFYRETPELLQKLEPWLPSKNEYENSFPLAQQLTEVAYKASQSNVFPTMEGILNEFPLSKAEGLALMCLAESLVRVTDRPTRMALLHDQIKNIDWAKSFNMDNALWLNSMIFGTEATKRMLDFTQNDVHTGLTGLVARYGEQFLDMAVTKIISVAAYQFVMGQTIEEAMAKVDDKYAYSFDMLGEAALDAKDAAAYFDRYKLAVDALSSQQNMERSPTLSIKLSALHPRYEVHQEQAVYEELYPKVLELVQHAANQGVSVTIDAEESFRLEPSLQLFKKLRMALPEAQRSKLGLVVQAYQRRALPVIEFLEQHAKESNASIPLRLVKGAYWDQEVKWAQQMGVENYPVFTDKRATDLSYLACIGKLLSNLDAFYPQFATHNANTVATILTMVEERGIDTDRFELQKLFGMGDGLHDKVLEKVEGLLCRTYAPVGKHKELLPYLVRRMIENGANTSFVNQMGSSDFDAANATENLLALLPELAKELIDSPRDLYRADGVGRLNSKGVNLESTSAFNELSEQVRATLGKQWQAGPSSDVSVQSEKKAVFSPAIPEQKIGELSLVSKEGITAVVDQAQDYFPTWRQVPVDQRADMLRTSADLFEQNMPELIGLLMLEAGKTYGKAVDEIREGVDFLRYYAEQAEDKCSPTICRGPTGELNTMERGGMGVWACVSPWNFPAAIFTGQIAAALAAGNTVVAKPALETSLVGAKVIELMHEAGIPKQALQYMPAENADCDQALWADQRIRGVAFTGSTAAAQHINLQLAQRGGAIPRLIAETGGQNAMIIDSSALMDQAVVDLVESAFGASGQRCSAVRVAYVQEEVKDQLIELLEGRLKTQRVGNPLEPSVDFGPVISDKAKQNLEAYIDDAQQRAKEEGKYFYRADAELIDDQRSIDDGRPGSVATGHFVQPAVIEIGHVSDIGEERFGPVLHIIPFAMDELDNGQVVDEINSTGYGLTFGVHTRLDGRAETLAQQVQAGSIYINRNTVGAVVETQPFGGQNLSGTGPKAGGPDYLLAFLTGKTISNNISAKGGNPELYSRSEKTSQ